MKIPGNSNSKTGERFIYFERLGKLLRVVTPNGDGTYRMKRFSSSRWDEAIQYRDREMRKLKLL